MGCGAYGPVSTAMYERTQNMPIDTLEMFGLTLLDLRPSEVPEWADRDWWRQSIIDFVARKVGELAEEGKS